MLLIFTSMLSYVKTVMEVFICVESGVIKLLVVFVFSANSAASVNGNDANFVATNCVFLLFFFTK